MTAFLHWLRLSVCGLCLAALWVRAGVPVTAQDVSQVPDRAYGLAGAQIFRTHCAPCHGESGAGDGAVLQDMETDMIDFRDPAILAAERSPLLWQQVTAEGRIDNLMPPWQNQLTAEQMWDAVAFLWQLSTSAEELARGAEVWQSLGRDADLQALSQAALTLSFADWQAAGPRDMDAETWRPLPAGDQAALYRYLQARVLTPSWEPLLRAGPGTVSVRLQPLSPGLDLPADLPVTLKARIGPVSAGEWTNTVHREDGRRAFQGLDTSLRISYRAEVEWEDLQFQSGPVSLTAAEDTAELAVEVFAVSDTQVAVAIAQLQILLALSEDAILIGQQALAANSLPYVFTGRSQEGLSAPVTVEIPLFPGAAAVTPADGDSTRFEVGEDKVWDRAPLFPLSQGTWSTVGYGLPWPAPGDTWVQTWLYPVSDITVLVPQREDWDVEIVGFGLSGTREIGDIAHDTWHASTLPDGQVVVRFNAVPMVATATAQLPSVELMPSWLPWGLALFLLLLLVSFTAFTGRNPGAAGQDSRRSRRS